MRVSTILVLAATLTAAGLVTTEATQRGARVSPHEQVSATI